MINYELTDRAIDLIKKESGFDISRKDMLNLLVEYGVLNKDGTASEYAIKNGLIG